MTRPAVQAQAEPDEVAALHAYVLEQLEITKGNWPSVAEGSGVPYRSLEKIARREVKDPGITAIGKLVRYFRVRERLQ